MEYLKIKRPFDIILSIAGLIVLSPVFLLLILAIKIDSPGPILFKQKRVGIQKSYFNILKGEMSIIGPRPALWNQYDLIEERDQYGANNICPGLTGWAQINGCDELEIPIKAKLDGAYVKKMFFSLDIHCFVRTIISVFKREGVVEGSTADATIFNEKKGGLK